MWRAVADPFVVPQAVHRCRPADWELVDCDVAGCVVCGRGHLCAHETCPLVAYEGRQVCEITGFCVRNHQYAEDEYVDTAVRPTQHAVPVVRTFEWGQIDGWVYAALCSAAVRASLQLEAHKRAARARSIFVRLAKHCKAQRTPVNLVHLCTLMAHSMATVRRPRFETPARLRDLARACVQAVAAFCTTFFDASRCVPPPVKMHGFVVGLLYLMRTGMTVCGNVQIVPMVRGLDGVLPSENQVKPLFHLSTKIMTEVENVIKMALRRHEGGELFWKMA
jgi:hypothetical protein